MILWKVEGSTEFTRHETVKFKGQRNIYWRWITGKDSKQKISTELVPSEEVKKTNRPRELKLTEGIEENKQCHLQLYQGKRNTRERMAHQ